MSSTLLLASLLAACSGTSSRSAATAPPTMSATPPEGAIPQATVTQLPVDAMPVDTPPATVSGTELPLPDEPWYRDKPEHYDECVAPLPTIPAQHFPAPFSACDPRVESFTSPPGGNELHFHYREFSASLTAQRSTASTATCCYMIFEFPRRD